MKDTVDKKVNLNNTPQSENQADVEEKVLPVTPQSSFLAQNKQLFLVGGVILAILVVGLVVALLKSGYKSNVSYVRQPTVSPINIPTAKPTLLRSIAPGIITKVLTAKSTDPTTGEAVNPTTSFTLTDKNIFLVLSLKSPKVGLKFEYVRYINNVYLDKGSLVVTKPSTNNLSFVWTLKKVGSTHQAGQYRVKVYSNGIFEKETSFIVR